MNFSQTLTKPLSLPRRADLWLSERCIIGAEADMLFLWGAPVFALLATLVWVGAFTTIWPSDAAVSAFTFAGTALTFAHLLPVFVRSHLNPEIFAPYRLRLTVAPIALLAAVIFVKPAFIVAGVLGVFWDVYHSAQQNFGLARIYDVKAGNPAQVGRTLDRMISHVLYVGPIAAGSSLLPTIDPLKNLHDVGWEWMTTAPQLVGEHASTIRLVVVVLSFAAWVIYVIGQWRLARQGYNVSAQKVALMASTAFASIFGWGLSAPAVAFAAMNIFHAVQYFALVWKTEGPKVGMRLGIEDADWQKVVAFALIFAVPAAFGIANAANVNSWNVISGVYISVSLLHFWMDGFIWSVRRNAV